MKTAKATTQIMKFISNVKVKKFRKLTGPEKLDEDSGSSGNSTPTINTSLNKTSPIETYESNLKVEVSILFKLKQQEIKKPQFKLINSMDSKHQQHMDREE